MRQHTQKLWRICKNASVAATSFGTATTTPTANNFSSNANTSHNSNDQLPTVGMINGTRRQSTNSILLVPPNQFATYNSETAQDNTFMSNDISVTPEMIHKEWLALKNALVNVGVRVVTPSTPKNNVYTPDSLFPNNWISTFSDTIVLYPMKAISRRMEVREDIITQLATDFYKFDSLEHVDINNINTIYQRHSEFSNPNKDNDHKRNIYDLRGFGFERNLCLEGTGAIVLDHVNRTAYFSLSQRCDALAALHWSNMFGYNYVMFESYLNDKIIYHTNVMMSIGTTFAVVAMECIDGDMSREQVKHALEMTGREIMEISGEQVAAFCGNVIELELGSNDNSGNVRKGLIMSERAYNAFTKEQIDFFENKHGLEIVKVNVDHVETVMGGGVRCMIAELFE